MSISQSELKELFDYRDDGVLVRKVATSGPSGAVGTVVGSFTRDTTRPGKGYMVTKIRGKHYCVHRLIWLWHHGEMPECVDHVDRDTRNNRVENLRSASSVENMANRKMFSNNTSGCKGVHWHKRQQKWYAYVGVGGRNKSLGYFDDFAKAVGVATEARNQIHGQFAALN